VRHGWTRIRKARLEGGLKPTPRLRRDRCAFAFGGAGFLILLLKLIDAARGVNQLLAAGEERVAVGANFNADVALMRRARLKHVSTGADYIELVISGVNSSFHFKGNLSEFSLYRTMQTPVCSEERTGVG